MKKILLKDFACIKVIFYLSNIFIISICITNFSIQNAYAIECPPPPQQFTNEISGNVKGELRGALQKLVGGSLEGKVDVIANNLFSQYPNADRLTLAVGIMSMYCQIINESTQWDDNRKLQAVNEMNTQILKLINPPDASSNIPELYDQVSKSSSPDGSGLRPVYSIINKNGGKVLNIEREVLGYGVVFAGKCNGNSSKRFGVKYFCSSTYRENPEKISTRGSELLNIALPINDINNSLNIIDEILKKRSDICIEQAKIYCPVKFSYDDVYGSKHQRFFGTSVNFYKKIGLSRSGRLKNSGSIEKNGFNYNSKAWDSHKKISKWIEKTCWGRIDFDDFLNAVATEIIIEKSAF